MTFWHHTHARDTTKDTRPGRDGSRRPRDAVRSTDRWPAWRAFLFMVVTSLALWAVIIAGLWALL